MRPLNGPGAADASRNNAPCRSRNTPDTTVKNLADRSITLPGYLVVADEPIVGDQGAGAKLNAERQTGFESERSWCIIAANGRED
jgi:hypothetical protein